MVKGSRPVSSYPKPPKRVINAKGGGAIDFTPDSPYVDGPLLARCFAAL
jgi:hypothetical protein